MATQTQPMREEPRGPAAEAQVALAPSPNGPALAAMLAAAIGVFALGLLTTLAAAGEGVKEWLAFQERVGPLSGKTTMAGVAWLVTWGTLHLAFWRRDLPFGVVVAIVVILLVVGNLLMFPPIFTRLEPS